MLRGEVHLKSTWLRFLGAGQSWSRLDFVLKGQRRSRETLEMDQEDEKLAFKCTNCGVLCILPRLLNAPLEPEDW
ncbi:MAG: hypothetical protein MUF13_03730 [Akkermansiaceae bacterium]|jgi:hypothetical protein|nr:hypothetical protein [Akkermansiaceae bacterium]